MAGGDYHPYKVDPAIDRWQQMHDSMYERFRMTTKNTRTVFLWTLTVPVLIYYVADFGNNRWALQGKTRGQPLLRNPPAAKPAANDDE